MMKMANLNDLKFEADRDGMPHSPMPGDMHLSKSRYIRISLKQWRMFHAVVDFDGFAEAAERLHVSQSSISHALSKLQEQLGLSLLTLKGRKAHITEEGRILLERSRDLVRNALELEEMAEYLRLGHGPEIRLAVDPHFPPELLTHALGELASSSCRVRLTVREAAAVEASQALHQDAVDFAISAAAVHGFVNGELLEIEHVAVAHPENPLFALNREVSFDDLKTQPRVAVSGISDYLPSDTQPSLRPGARQWNVDSLDRALAMLGKGLGYAWLPKYKLQRCLETDCIGVLPMNAASRHTVRLYLILGRSAIGSPKALRFADALRSASASWASTSNCLHIRQPAPAP